MIEPGKKFQDHLPKFNDSASKAKFAKKYDLTFPLLADGKVVKRWDGVKVDGHAEEVLAAAQAL